MGYTHDAGFCVFTSPFEMFGDTAAWAVAAGEVANTVVYACDATDETANLFAPLKVLASHLPNSAGVAVKGSMITKVLVAYEILVAACDSVTPVIYKVKRGADGADAVVTEVAFTYDAAHDTDDERDDLDEHLMELTITTPEYMEDDEEWHIAIAFDKAATSTVDMIGIWTYQTARL